MIKKILATALCMCSIPALTFAGFSEHYTQGQEYLKNYQYSSAIQEFQNALKINYLDNSARIGLVNSYLANGAFLANKQKDYNGAANCYRSALFYLLYYPEGTSTGSAALSQVKSNLEKCLNEINFDKSAQNRFNTARELRAEGNFAAAGYEYMQTLGEKQYVKDSFEQMGSIMKVLRNNPKSVEYYRKAVAIAPDDVNLRLSYAKMLDITGEEDLAVNEFNRILSQTDKNEEVLYALERIYKKKLDKSPSDANVTTNLGAILQKQGKLDEALAYYSKAEALDKNNINARINTGTLYQQKKDYEKALAAYDSVLMLYPKNIQANLYKAQTYDELGRKKDAQIFYEKVLALDPANEQASYGLKNILRSTLSTTEFIDYVKKNSRTGKPADELYLYALDLHKSNKLNDAITIYKEVIMMAPNNAEAYVNLALAQNQNNDTEGAITLLKAAREKFPKNTQVEQTLNTIYSQVNDEKLAKASELYKNGDFEQAIQIYSNITPMTEDIMLTIATCWQNLDNQQEAIAAYKKAFEINPKNADTAYYIATILIDYNSDSEEGMKYINKALAIDPKHVDSLQLKQYLAEQAEMKELETAMSHFEQQNYDDSMKILNKIISQNENNAYAYYYRGMIYDAKENPKSAIKDYEKAVELNNDLSIIYYLLGLDYDILEETENALKNFEIFVANYSENDEYKTYASDRVKDLKSNES